jgi:hypothetical protein
MALLFRELLIGGAGESKNSSQGRGMPSAHHTLLRQSLRSLHLRLCTRPQTRARDRASAAPAQPRLALRTSVAARLRLSARCDLRTAGPRSSRGVAARGTQLLHSEGG